MRKPGFRRFRLLAAAAFLVPDVVSLPLPFAGVNRADLL